MCRPTQTPFAQPCQRLLSLPPHHTVRWTVHTWRPRQLSRNNAWPGAQPAAQHSAHTRTHRVHPPAHGRTHTPAAPVPLSLCLLCSLPLPCRGLSRRLLTQPTEVIIKHGPRLLSAHLGLHFGGKRARHTLRLHGRENHGREKQPVSHGSGPLLQRRSPQRTRDRGALPAMLPCLPSLGAWVLCRRAQWSVLGKPCAGVCPAVHTSCIGTRMGPLPCWLYLLDRHARKPLPCCSCSLRRHIHLPSPCNPCCLAHATPTPLAPPWSPCPSRTCLKTTPRCCLGPSPARGAAASRIGRGPCACALPPPPRAPWPCPAAPRTTPACSALWRILRSATQVAGSVRMNTRALLCAHAGCIVLFSKGGEGLPCSAVMQGRAPSHRKVSEI